MPIDLTVTDLGHTTNWLLVSDIVNATSRTYRTARQVSSPCIFAYRTITIVLYSFFYTLIQLSNSSNKYFSVVNVDSLFQAECLPSLWRGGGGG